ncbi:helix-turn-helix domain-containing protein [Pedobacter sp. UC225_61]|uniref:helix-turn-helix domain-containing protein n=1 Tax=Pedobacter sp. UC225_61 TaxID=3374623 RepID=UPI0037ADC143
MVIKHNLGIAGRFQTFRKKYISRSGVEAAKELNISQAGISRMENGIDPINSEIIKKLIDKFQLNKQWLLDNIGSPINKAGKLKPTPLLLSEIMDREQALITEVAILKKNFSKLWDVVEHQGKEIDRLNEKNHN